MISDPMRIEVDLVPLLPGGENGGAKLLAIELVKQLSRIASNWEFILFTSEDSHEELAGLDSHNVHRLCVLSRRESSDTPASWTARLESWMRDKLRTILPLSVRMRLDHIYVRGLSTLYRGSFLRKERADLLFCPFTAPSFHDPGVPVVSIIYDLQYHYYPQFFTEEDRSNRERNFIETCRHADKLISISAFVRKTVLENSNLSPDNVVSIPIQLPNRLSRPAPKTIQSVLQHFSLKENEFLLYPANFWPHKNHRMLFAAFGIYRARHPESDLRLVCPGALDEQKRALLDDTRRVNQQESILLPGFLPDEELAAMLASCLALIFPSLYEGFGMPVLEAMAFGKPVICSNVTSLPEVAGDAACYVDPMNPLEIADSIERITTDEELVKHLVARGHRRSTAFGNPEKMAREYIEIFQELVRSRKGSAGSGRLP